MNRSAKRKLSLGFYPRKLVFFGLLFVVALTGFSYTRYLKSSADSASDYQVSSYSGEKSIIIEIQKNGNYLVDGKSAGKLKSIDGFDELRLLVADKPVDYLDSLKISVKLPSDVAAKVDHQILAIHGVDSSFSDVSSADIISYQAYGVSGAASVTVVAKLPKGIIAEPFMTKVFSGLGNIKFNFWLILAIALPILTFAYMLLFTAFQMRLNKVDKPDQPINKPPMSIPPALVGVLYHQEVGAREVSATLIDLAKRKDIVILDRDRGFAFGKGKFDTRLLGFEKLLLSKIFKNNMTSDQQIIEERIANHLYSKKISAVSAGIYSLATRLGYFRFNPRKIHAKYRLFGILAFLLGAGGFVLSYILDFMPAFTAFFWVGMMISALIVAFSAHRIPLRTPLGNEALTNWLAFRNFLSDSSTIEYSPEIYAVFEQYLPYAVALDCEAAWARRFEKHNFVLPEWFLTDKEGLGIDEFCLALFPIVSYVGRSFSAIREPGFE